MTGGARETRADVEACADLAGRLATEVHHGLLQRLETVQQGLRAPVAAGSAGAGHSGHSDPTAASALAGSDRVTALARLHQAELGRAVRRARVALARAIEVAQLYGEPHPSGAGDLLALGRINARVSPGCENCSRIEGEAGGPRWEPTHPGLAGPTDLGGRLAKALWLCRWCAAAGADWGRLPSEAELRRHHAGLRVSWPSDVPRPHPESVA